MTNRKTPLAKTMAAPVLVRRKPVPMVPGNICPTCGCLLPTAVDRAVLRRNAELREIGKREK